MFALLRDAFGEDLDNELDETITLGYDEFGVRTMLIDHPNRPYLVDWALDSALFTSDDQALTRRSGARASGRVLHQNRIFSELFDPTRNPLPAAVLDRSAGIIETFIAIDSLFTGDERTLALHAITTCNSESGYLSAVSKELELWLSHRSINASRLSLHYQNLAGLVEDTISLKREAGRVAGDLGRSAHLLAETEVKRDAYIRRLEFVEKIDELLASGEKLGHLNRFWVNSVRAVVDDTEPQHQTREQYLRFAVALANKSVSIARTILSESDVVKDRRPIKNRKTLAYHVEKYNAYIDKANERSFSCRIPSRIQADQIKSGDLQKRLSEGAQILEDTRASVLDIYSRWSYPEKPEVLKTYEDDRSLLLWDITAYSQEQHKREALEAIHRANETVTSLDSNDRGEQFVPDQDDGNGLVCWSVLSALKMFKAIAEQYAEAGYSVKAGVHTTYGGEKLWKNTRTGFFGGRPYDVTARMMSVFKEAQGTPYVYTTTNGETLDFVAPESSYVVLSDQALRTLTTFENEPVPRWLVSVGVLRDYQPRVKTTLPTDAHIFILSES
jgi:hypothetical protein